MDDKKALLVISFGTSYEETMKKTIIACEQTLSAAFPLYDLKRAFTSFKIINKLKRVNNMQVDTPIMALEKLRLENYSHVLVQPLHIIPGQEYNHKVLHSILPFKNKFKSLKIGKPLLYKHGDYEELVQAICDSVVETKAGETIVFMGHGSDHPANSTYSCLQAVMNDRILDYHIGCVEGYPEIDTIIERIKDKSYKKIHLYPLMLVAGDHARNDMAGDEDSWKTILQSEGYEVETHLQGLGENHKVQNMFVNKAKDLMGG